MQWEVVLDCAISLRVVGGPPRSKGSLGVLQAVQITAIVAMIRIKIKTIKETSCAPRAPPNSLQKAQMRGGTAPDPFQPPVARAEPILRVFASHRAFRLPAVCPNSPSLISAAQDLF